MKAKQHQIDGAKEAYSILKKNAIVYIAWEERTGKSITALLIAEQAKVINVLIITKKGGKERKTIRAWIDLLSVFTDNTKIYRVTTYHQVQHVGSVELWDLIILDEPHNYLSAFPNRSKIWSAVRTLTKGKPIIYLSATPHAQTYGQLFNQLALSNWSPFRRYANYKQWHNDYGIPYTQYLYGRQIEMWDRVKDDLVREKTDHLFITNTRKNLDFEHEPEDNIHYIDPSEYTKRQYNQILKHKIYEVPSEDIVIEYDTKTKLRYGLHMLEGGVLKYTYYVLNKKGKPKAQVIHFDTGNTEKIDYIKERWGDNDNVAIMYNFIGEGKKLNNHFKHAAILQATTNAEGIDLMQFEHLIIYSQDYSTARHSQRRARQTNMNRKTPILVHFLLFNKGISEEVYDTVSRNKENYVDSRFGGNKL